MGIPTFLVGYKGPTSEKKLEKWFVNPRDRFFPNGVLVIESELFYGRSAGGTWRIAQGKASSVLAFLACVADSIRHAGNQHATLDSYVPLIQEDSA